MRYQPDCRAQALSYRRFVRSAQQKFRELNPKDQRKLNRGPYYVQNGMLYGAAWDRRNGAHYEALRGIKRLAEKRPLP